MPDDIASRFLSLHQPGSPLFIPNPWDVGSARVLCSLGFQALATTSGGFAMTLGRPDGSVSREEALAHAASIVAAVPVPVSADFENGFADDLDGVARTYAAAVETGLAGASIEDYDGHELYSLDQAADRVAAARSAAGDRFVLTARAENHIRGNPGLSDTIARLQRYQEAGADVLYAPGVSRPDEVRTLVSEVDRPVNVLLLPGGATVAELADLGVSRISVGGALACVSMTALVEAARELLAGSAKFLDRGGPGREAARQAFSV